MIVLEKYKLLQKAIGLNPDGGHGNTAVRVLISVLFLFLNLFVLIYFFLNIHDNIDRALSVLPALCGGISIMAVYWHLLIRRERFYSLLCDLQDIVNGSM